MKHLKFATCINISRKWQHMLMLETDTT